MVFCGLSLPASLSSAAVLALSTSSSIVRIADPSLHLGLLRLLGNRKSPGESSHRSCVQRRWVLLTSFGLGATIETDLSTHDREAGGFQPVQLPEAGGGLGRVAKGGLCQMR